MGHGISHSPPKAHDTVVQNLSVAKFNGKSSISNDYGDKNYEVFSYFKRARSKRALHFTI